MAFGLAEASKLELFEVLAGSYRRGGRVYWPCERHRAASSPRTPCCNHGTVAVWRRQDGKGPLYLIVTYACIVSERMKE